MIDGQKARERQMSPQREDIPKLQTPLNAGEQAVLDCLDKHLPLDWEICIQPHMNGYRPDFVLLHPLHGIAVVEVKDWHDNGIRYWSVENTVPWVMGQRQSGPTFPVDNPVEIMASYLEVAANLYCPRLACRLLEMPRSLPAVRGYLVMTGMSDQRAGQLLGTSLAHWSKKTDFPIEVCGQEALDAGRLAAMLGEATVCTENTSLGGELLKDLRSWLLEPDFSSTQRAPLDLDENQARLASNRTSSGYRRLRGQAGSGKSVVLAQRAANLVSEGKSVLVVCYTITLVHYLRDLISRGLRQKLQVRWRRPGSLTVVHFHGWCKQVCEQASPQYQQEYATRMGQYEDRSGTDKKLDVDLPALTKRVLDDPFSDPTLYDAILVDEGQDFNLDWWQMLRKVREAAGEMVLAADQTQDIYGRSSTWTEEKMIGCGFSGAWSELRTCYRMPQELAGDTYRFATMYLGHNEAPPLPRAQDALPYGRVHKRWIQVSQGDVVSRFVEEFLRLPASDDGTTELPYADVVMLVPSHSAGVDVLEEMQRRSCGINLCRTVDRDKRTARKLKCAFWGGDPRAKLTTLHSFKGWESRAVLVLVNRDTPKSLRELYVALTRLKGCVGDSYITVVCSAPGLQEYGRGFSESTVQTSDWGRYYEV